MTDFCHLRAREDLDLMELHALQAAVRDAWSSIPAPPEEDLQYMAWGWGEAAAEAFIGVAPMNIDMKSKGFFAATPLLDLPARAAAAYLGTFLLDLLRGLDVQKKVGIFTDLDHRPHTLTCLELPDFWEDIKPYLPPRCREVLAQVALLVASEHETFLLSPEHVNIIKGEATKFLKALEDK